MSDSSRISNRRSGVPFQEELTGTSSPVRIDSDLALYVPARMIEAFQAGLQGRRIEVHQKPGRIPTEFQIGDHLRGCFLCESVVRLAVFAPMPSSNTEQIATPCTFSKRGFLNRRSERAEVSQERFPPDLLLSSEESLRLQFEALDFSARRPGQHGHELY
jgi:hypothetical protein